MWPLCRANHFEAQFYLREVGKARSLGVFPYDPTCEASKELAAAKAAAAADRAVVKYYESLHQDVQYIGTRLNVRHL
jgi:hypothetical protein